MASTWRAYYAALDGPVETAAFLRGSEDATGWKSMSANVGRSTYLAVKVLHQGKSYMGLEEAAGGVPLFIQGDVLVEW
jgi:hypothetical protein